MQIWDTAGQEQYRSITMRFIFELCCSHYKNAAGALVVFDVTNRNSFGNVSRWISDVRDRANQNCVIGIVGNKIDLDRRSVSRDQAENLASRERAFYAETTIMDLQTIKNVFDRLAQCKNTIYVRGVPDRQDQEPRIQPHKRLTKLQLQPKTAVKLPMLIPTIFYYQIFYVFHSSNSKILRIKGLIYWFGVFRNWGWF